MKAFLIPGNGEHIDSRDYHAVLKAYETYGYEPEFLDVHWKYRTIDHWTERVLNTLPAAELRSSLLSGFSWGSMIAFNVAARINPKQLLLFSLSPYFQEDLRALPPIYLKWAGARRVEAFSRLSFDALAPRIQCPTGVFVGSIEKEKYQGTARQAEEAYNKIAGSELIVVPGVSHDVGAPAYVEAIKRWLQNHNS